MAAATHGAGTPRNGAKGGSGVRRHAAEGVPARAAPPGGGSGRGVGTCVGAPGAGSIFAQLVLCTTLGVVGVRLCTTSQHCDSVAGARTSGEKYTTNIEKFVSLAPTIATAFVIRTNAPEHTV